MLATKAGLVRYPINSVTHTQVPLYRRFIRLLTEEIELTLTEEDWEFGRRHMNNLCSKAWFRAMSLGVKDDAQEEPARSST